MSSPLVPSQVETIHQYRNKVVGCLAGGAIGDALGAPIEFYSLDQIRQRFGAEGITGYERYAGGLGMITDDTQMTLFTAEGLITTMIADDNVFSRFGPAREGNAWADPTPHVYRSYLRWLKTQNASEAPRPAPSWLAGQDWLYSSRAPGNACTSGLAFGGMGTRDTPKNPGSKGCETVMRAAPFGLQKFKDPDQVFEEAIDASVLTHGHPSGYLAAGALAVYAALCYPEPERFRQALLLSVNHSGDSDSTGSVCGNILGAWHGPLAFPQDLAFGLEGIDTFNQIADDFAEVNWPEWRRRATPEHLADLAARYPAE